MLWRAVRRRCPWCGGRGACFTGWFRKTGHCQSCGLQWRRGDVGFELGAATVSVILTFGPLLLLLAGMMAITWPEVRALPMFIALAVVAVVLPVLIYGPSHLIWQSIDIVMRPPDPDDFVIVADPSESDAPSTSA